MIFAFDWYEKQYQPSRKARDIIRELHRVRSSELDRKGYSLSFHDSSCFATTIIYFRANRLFLPSHAFPIYLRKLTGRERRRLPDDRASKQASKRWWSLNLKPSVLVKRRSSSRPKRWGEGPSCDVVSGRSFVNSNTKGSKVPKSLS